MGRFGLVIAGTLSLALPLGAQGITIKSKEGQVEAHGEAKKAEPGDAIGPGMVKGDPKAMTGFVRDVQKVQHGLLAEGDLTQDEINALEEKARKKLEKDMAKLGEREREAAAERDPADKAEQTLDVRKDRYRASLRALERDLLFSVESIRDAGRGNLESELDDLSDRIKDTFADLHDKIDDGMPESWPGTLNDARKFHKDYDAQIDKWAGKIGVNPEVPNAKERVVEMKKSLIARVKRLRKIGSDKYQDQLDDVEERIYASFEGLEEKIEDSDPAAWTTILKDADKFMLNYTAELDGWAKKIGVDETLPSPLERLAELNRDIDQKVDDLRRIGGEEYEDAIDEIAERVDEVFADLKDKILNESKEAWAGTLETAAKYHKQFCETIELWERKIVGANGKIERKLPETPGAEGSPRPEYPEKDVPLTKGEHMDIIEGVRVARLMPLPRKQLGLDHGLSVNEIVDADKPLARAKLEV
ncbi:MAG: hypothetical protein H6840_12980, partial [Planctomycetes bacterium]|nr:hypothetical protein [Planctomycetota bacterium]